MSPQYRNVIRYLIIGFGINLVIGLFALVLAPIMSVAYLYTMASFAPGLLIGALIMPRFGTNAPAAIYAGTLLGLLTAPLTAMAINGILAGLTEGFPGTGFSPAAWLWALVPAISMVLIVVIDVARDRRTKKN